MTAIPLYNAEGVKTGEIAVDANLFDKTVRRGLLKEALIAHLASQRQGTHATKSRAFVAGGGKKPWKQKGTGRARQGSTRSPQWVGGGHAHHIKPRDYAYQLPVGQRRVALLSSLRYRLEKNAIFAVEGLDALKAPSTKAVSGFLGKAGLIKSGARSALVVSEGLVTFGNVGTQIDMHPAGHVVVRNRSLRFNATVWGLRVHLHTPPVRFVEHLFGEEPAACGSILYAGSRFASHVELLEAGGHIYK